MSSLPAYYESDLPFPAAGDGWGSPEHTTGQARWDKAHRLAAEWIEALPAKHRAKCRLVHGQIRFNGQWLSAWVETPVGVYEPVSNNFWSPPAFVFTYGPSIEERMTWAEAKPRLEGNAARLCERASCSSAKWGPWRTHTHKQETPGSR